MPLTLTLRSSSVQRRDVPAKATQAADQGNVPAGSEAGERVRQGVLAADLEHFAGHRLRR